MVSLSGPKLQPSSLETRVRILYYVLSMLDYKRGIEMLNRLINMKRDKTEALIDSNLSVGLEDLSSNTQHEI